MSLDSLWFLVKSAFHNMRRNVLLTVATVTVLAICLTLLGGTFLVVQNVNACVDEIGESRVAVFLREDMTYSEVEAFKQQLVEIGNIGQITYESKATAFENYKKMLGDAADVDDILDPETFRASLIFEIKDLSKYDQTMYAIQKLDGAENITQHHDVVDRILQVKQVVAFLSAVIVLLFFIVSMFIIMNSVKLSVYARRLEINIMKYVGATDLFIQLPYFIEGMMNGLIAGVISFFLEWYVYDHLLYPVFAALFTPLTFLSGVSLWIPFFLVGGVLIGIIGSVYPVKKYLKV